MSLTMTTAAAKMAAPPKKDCFFAGVAMDVTSNFQIERGGAYPRSAGEKNLFAPLSRFSELYKSSENLGFQWRRKPLLGFPHTPFTRKGYAASVERRSR